MSRSPYASVLAHRELRRFLPWYAVAAIGDGMAVVAVAWTALQLAPAAGREHWVAAAAAAYTLPAAAGAVLLRPVLAAQPPHRLVLWDSALRAGALAAIPLAHAAGVLGIGFFVAALGVSSVLHAWGQAGVFGLVAGALGVDDRLAGNSLLASVGGFATVVGPAVAAPLIAGAGGPVVFALVAAGYAALGLSSATAPRRSPSAAEPGHPPRAPGPVLALLGMSACFFLLFGTVYVALPLHAAGTSGGPALLAAYYSAFGVGAVLGGIAAGYLRAAPLWPTTIGVVGLVGGLLAVVGLDVPLWLHLPAFALVGFLWPPYASLTTTLIQNSSSPAGLSQALAATSAVRVLSVPLGTAAGGPLVAALDPGGALLVAAAGIVGVAVVAGAVRISRSANRAITARSLPRPAGAGHAEPMTTSRNILSYRSSGSILSICSTDSVLSVGSTGSILSVASLGSVLSVLSAASFGSVLSVGSFGSLLTIGTAAAVLTTGSWAIAGLVLAAVVVGLVLIRLAVRSTAKAGVPRLPPRPGTDV